MKMDGKWVFTLQVPSMIPFLQYSDRRDLREKLFTGYFMKSDNDNDHDNKAIIAKIAKLRIERSHLLGYKSYADFALERNMAKTPKKVFEFLNQVWAAATPVAKTEAAAQQELIKREGGKFKLEPLALNNGLYLKRFIFIHNNFTCIIFSIYCEVCKS